MIFGLTLFVLVVLAALWLVVQPLRGSVPADPDAPERARLTAERDRLYAELSNLPDEARRPDFERRAALTLRSLDALPPAPPPRERGGRTRTLALTGLALAALVTAAGAVTLVPRWQLASLGAGEAQDVRDVLALPGLRRKAEATGDKGAYLAWGRAAFDSARYAQAVIAYGNALKLDPRQPEALRRLGILLLTRPDAQGQGAQQPSPEEARQAFRLIQAAAGLAPNEPESQLLLGFALARFGQDQGALTALERYRTLDPRGRDADELITAIRARQNETDPGLGVYAANCASCHGPNGQGGLGPNLRASTLSREALRGVIVNGKGAMPAYPNLKPDELNALLDVLERWQKEGQ
ncbi:cytochrome c family protein [Deinococcus aetherius]|uniref:Cytochrome c family protein n=1 Tax=Deinococcus aetherius TaxID=200252 RepID=A0ABN6RI82_9DEIO|nr:c-type cytochrome [Deinococcus aetherius]BDP41738.1 cytochrome c family protein [Deinococcus aetherius]